jgi:hypothetical protein
MSELMNNKLNQIKRNWEWYNSNDNTLYGLSDLLSNDDIEYLIKQSEEKEQLEKQINSLVEDYKQIVNIMLWMFRRQPKMNKESVYKDLKDTIVNKALLDFKELMKNDG